MLSHLLAVREANCMDSKKKTSYGWSSCWPGVNETRFEVSASHVTALVHRRAFRLLEMNESEKSKDFQFRFFLQCLSFYYSISSLCRFWSWSFGQSRCCHFYLLQFIKYARFV